MLAKGQAQCLRCNNIGPWLDDNDTAWTHHGGRLGTQCVVCGGYVLGSETGDEDGRYVRFPSLDQTEAGGLAESIVALEAVADPAADLAPGWYHDAPMSCEAHPDKWWPHRHAGEDCAGPGVSMSGPLELVDAMSQAAFERGGGSLKITAHEPDGWCAEITLDDESDVWCGYGASWGLAVVDLLRTIATVQQ